MSDKDAYSQKLEAQLEEAQAEIARLRARGKSARADARLSIEHEVDTLGEHRDELERRLSELRGAGDEAWNDLKSGLEASSAALREALHRASSRFSS